MYNITAFACRIPATLACLLLLARAHAQIPDNIEVTQEADKVDMWSSPLFIIIVVATLAFVVLFFRWSRMKRKKEQ